MRVSDFFVRLAVTIAAIGLAVVGAMLFAGVEKETAKTVGIVVVSIVTFVGLLAFIAAVWE